MVNEDLPRFGEFLITEEECSYVWNIPEPKRCAWVKATDDCATKSHLPYVEILFCTVGSSNKLKFNLAVVGFFLWILYLFLILGTTADNFFVPNLSIISSVLYLSDSLAGVTILAFGNGAPDIFTSIVANEEDRLIMFTELISAGIFVTAFIVGSIVLVAPFRVPPANFLRDALFYFFGVCWIRLVILDSTIQLFEALTCLLIYVLFIVTVIAMQKFEARAERRKKRIPTVHDPDVLRAFVENRDLDVHTVQAQLPPKRSRAFNVHAKLDIAIQHEMMLRGKRGKNQGEANPEPDEKRPKGLFKEFFYDIFPIYLSDWRKASWLMRIFLILRVPFMFLLQLCVPTVNSTTYNHGWSKLLNCVQIALTPLIGLSILRVWHRNVYPGVPLWAVSFGVSTLIAVLIFLTTSADKRPKYHSALAFVGFAKAMLIVYAVAQEVMAVLVCIGFAVGISDAMLGITLLAWGNSVGDLISNVTIARKGFAVMGLSACFGGPMFNTLVGLGLSFSVATLNATSYETHIRIGSMAPGCLAFLMISIMTSIIYLNYTGFIARKSYGYLLYTIYAVFLLFNLLAEVHYIHPLGTDHRPDTV